MKHTRNPLKKAAKLWLTAGLVCAALLPALSCRRKAAPAPPITEDEARPLIDELLAGMTPSADGAFFDLQLDGCWYRVAVPEASVALGPIGLLPGDIAGWTATPLGADATVPLLLATQEGESPLPLDLELQLTFAKAENALSVAAVSMGTGRGPVAAQPETLTFIDPALNLVFRLPQNWKDDMVWHLTTEPGSLYGEDLALALSVPLAPYSTMPPATLLCLYAYPNPLTEDARAYIRPFNILGENDAWTFALYFPTDVQWDEAVPETQALYQQAAGHIPAIMEAFLQENQVTMREDFHNDPNWPRN